MNPLVVRQDPGRAVGGAVLADHHLVVEIRHLGQGAVERLADEALGRGETWQFHYDRPYHLLKKDPAEFASTYREFALGFAVPPEIAFDPRVALDPLPYHGDPLSCTPERNDEAVLLDNLLTYSESLAQRSAEVDQTRA